MIKLQLILLVNVVIWEKSKFGKLSTYFILM